MPKAGDTGNGTYVTQVDGSGNELGAETTPQSVVTRPANTTAYAGSAATPQLVGNSVTAGSVAVPSFNIFNAGGNAAIPRMVLSTNAPSGWGNVAVVVTLWTAAPTYSTGDGATYTVATGAAKRRAQYSGTFVQYADGAVCELSPLIGTAPVLHPDVGATLYWDIQIQSAATPISGQTFTLTPEVWN